MTGLSLTAGLSSTTGLGSGVSGLWSGASGLESGSSTPVEYYSMLNTAGRIGDTSGFSLDWNNWTWQLNGGPTWANDMEHSIKWSGEKLRLRFELKNTDNDKAVSDTSGVRRCELDPQETVPNGVEHWAAFSVIFEPYSDPAGMAAISNAAPLFWQLHSGGLGGSPSIGLRRTNTGDLEITSRGTGQPTSIQRFLGALASYPMGTVEDWVIRFTPDSVNGALQVWRNGTSLINLTGIPLTGGDGTSYAKFGIYSALGIAGTLVTQVANYVRPQTTSLNSRVSSPPAWPTDQLNDTNAPTVKARQTSVNDVNATSWTPTLPTHAAGDYLMVVVTIDGTGTAPTTATSGWTRLISTDEGTNVTQAVFYYGSAGTMTAAPNGAVPAPTITQGSQMDSAVAFAMNAISAPTIEAAGASATGTNGNPPSLTLAGGKKPALWIATVGIDGIINVPTASPPGYSTLTTVTGGVTGGTITASAEWRGNIATENPGAFQHATEQRVQHTIAVSVPA
jgi:hypothetical protein